MENEPVINLSLGDGREIAATPDNSTAYSFVGALAMYNHVFIITDPERSVGMYVFNGSPAFDRIFQYMGENCYPAHLNLREVAQCDLSAFDGMIEKEIAGDLDDGVPEDWK